MGHCSAVVTIQVRQVEEYFMASGIHFVIGSSCRETNNVDWLLKDITITRKVMKSRPVKKEEVTKGEKPYSSGRRRSIFALQVQEEKKPQDAEVVEEEVEEEFVREKVKDGLETLMDVLALEPSKGYSTEDARTIEEAEERDFGWGYPWDKSQAMIAKLLLACTYSRPREEMKPIIKKEVAIILSRKCSAIRASPELRDLCCQLFTRLFSSVTEDNAMVKLQSNLVVKLMKSSIPSLEFRGTQHCGFLGIILLAVS